MSKMKASKVFCVLIVAFCGCSQKESKRSTDSSVLLGSKDRFLSQTGIPVHDDSSLDAITRISELDNQPKQKAGKNVANTRIMNHVRQNGNIKPIVVATASSDSLKRDFLKKTFLIEKRNGGNVVHSNRSVVAIKGTAIPATGNTPADAIGDTSGLYTKTKPVAEVVEAVLNDKDLEASPSDSTEDVEDLGYAGDSAVGTVEKNAKPVFQSEPVLNDKDLDASPSDSTEDVEDLGYADDLVLGKVLKKEEIAKPVAAVVESEAVLKKKDSEASSPSSSDSTEDVEDMGFADELALGTVVTKENVESDVLIKKVEGANSVDSGLADEEDYSDLPELIPITSDEANDAFPEGYNLDEFFDSHQVVHEAKPVADWTWQSKALNAIRCNGGKIMAAGAVALLIYGLSANPETAEYLAQLLKKFPGLPDMYTMTTQTASAVLDWAKTNLVHVPLVRDIVNAGSVSSAVSSVTGPVIGGLTAAGYALAAVFASLSQTNPHVECFIPKFPQGGTLSNESFSHFDMHGQSPVHLVTPVDSLNAALVQDNSLYGINESHSDSADFSILGNSYHTGAYGVGDGTSFPYEYGGPYDAANLYGGSYQTDIAPTDGRVGHQGGTSVDSAVWQNPTSGKSTGVNTVWTSDSGVAARPLSSNEWGLYGPVYTSTLGDVNASAIPADGNFYGWDAHKSALEGETRTVASSVSGGSKLVSSVSGLVHPVSGTSKSLPLGNGTSHLVPLVSGSVSQASRTDQVMPQVSGSISPASGFNPSVFPVSGLLSQEMASQLVPLYVGSVSQAMGDNQVMPQNSGLISQTSANRQLVPLGSASQAMGASQLVPLVSGSVSQSGGASLPFGGHTVIPEQLVSQLMQNSEVYFTTMVMTLNDIRDFALTKLGPLKSVVIQVNGGFFVFSPDKQLVYVSNEDGKQLVSKRILSLVNASELVHVMDQPLANKMTQLVEYKPQILYYAKVPSWNDFQHWYMSSGKIIFAKSQVYMFPKGANHALVVYSPDVAEMAALEDVVVLAKADPDGTEQDAGVMVLAKADPDGTDHLFPGFGITATVGWAFALVAMVAAQAGNPGLDPAVLGNPGLDPAVQIDGCKITELPPNEKYATEPVHMIACTGLSEKEIADRLRLKFIQSHNLVVIGKSQTCLNLKNGQTCLNPKNGESGWILLPGEDLIKEARKALRTVAQPNNDPTLFFRIKTA